MPCAKAIRALRLLSLPLRSLMGIQVHETGPPAWWEDASKALLLDEELFGTAAPPRLTHPWVVSLLKGQVLGGAWHLPACGLGGLVSVLFGSFYLLLMSCESIDLHEGHAWVACCSPAPQVEAAFADNSWSGIHVKAGDICLVPAGWSFLLLGLENLAEGRGSSA
eukprot:5152801-Lingulodinium_polyedra.AAC.1